MTYQTGGTRKEQSQSDGRHGRKTVKKHSYRQLNMFHKLAEMTWI